MNLLDLEHSLPNGLHDAEVRKIEIDYGNRQVTIDLAVWVGSLEGTLERREAYKEGRLQISGLLFLVMESSQRWLSV